MNSIGGFREGEIDGESFLLFNFLSQTENLSLQPLFFCPSLRERVQDFKRDDLFPLRRPEAKFFDFFPLYTSPDFSSLRSLDQEVQQFLDLDGFCKLPVVHRIDDISMYTQCNTCGGMIDSKEYYFCPSCNGIFHKECVESPLEVKHPFYPFQSLQLCSPPDNTFGLKCICCEGGFFDRMVYHCPTYNLSMHMVCAMKPIPFVINHPKRDSHPLTFFPKQAFLPCNVCGLIKELIPTYACFRCLFIVHQDCLYFPNVIRICRHQHRIYFTSSLPSGKWFCGVCRQKVDNNYGAYSCNKCNDYFVHTRCALRRDVWDGEDLEGVPEEPGIDMEPFEIITDGIILHFSHGHHLKLEVSIICDENKFCQACVLPIYEEGFYSCMEQCDFFLHETCASTLRLKYHPLHPHPLMVKVVTNEFGEYDKGLFCCDACRRASSGFVYKCPKEECEFQLDIRCALVSEPFEYQGHEHPLYLSLKPEETKGAICQICNKDMSPTIGPFDYGRKMLDCIECKYIICFKCATLPYNAKYNHDKHFLTFREGKERSDQSDWCEVCERSTVGSTSKGFYSCNDCCTTLHIRCFLGKDPYMKPGQTIEIDNLKELHVLRNNTMSRPICHGHKDRCQEKVVFKNKSMTFCSLSCIFKFTEPKFVSKK